MNNAKRILLMSLIACSVNAATVDANGQWNFSANESDVFSATTVNSTTNGLDLNAPGIFSNHGLRMDNWVINATNNGVNFIAASGYDSDGSDSYGNLTIHDSTINAKNGFYLYDTGQVSVSQSTVYATNIGVNITDGSFSLTNSNLTAGDVGILARFTGDVLDESTGGYIGLYDSTITAPIAIDFRNSNFINLDFYGTTTINGDILGPVGKLNTITFDDDALVTLNGKVENISMLYSIMASDDTSILRASNIYLSPSIYNEEVTRVILDAVFLDVGTYDTGTITFEGNMKIGVNYDGITSTGTSKTGKIIAGSFVNNGTIALVKSTDTQTSKTLIDELLANDPIAIKTSINDIIITANKVTINPFSLDSNLSPTTGWTSLTTADRVRADGLYAVDQIYTRTASSKTSALNSLFIPRSRVNLDNAEKHENILNNVMSEKDTKFLDVKYIGNFSGKYDETSKNYGYKNNGNGIAITSGRAFTDKLDGAISFQYINSDIDYTGNSKESIDSLSFAGGLNYSMNNLDLGVIALVEKNSHNKTINMINNKDNTADFDSTVGILTAKAGYNYELGEGFKILPKIELGLISVHEDKEEYGKVVVSKMTKTSGFFRPSISLEKTYGNFIFNTGLGYKVYLGDGLHESRLIENTNGLLEVPQLEYDRGTLDISLGLSYKMTNNLSLNASYEYLRNKGFDNNNATLGVSFTF